MKNVVLGALGSLVAGATLGLVEAGYHLATEGAPDLWSPLYGVVLYAALSLPFGVGAGIAVTILQAVVRKRWRVQPWLPWVAGAVASRLPLLGFVLYYLANKVVYLEQGVPLSGKLAIVGILAALTVVELVAGRLLLMGRLKALLTPAGSLGVVTGLAALTGVLAVLPLQEDPRAALTADAPNRTTAGEGANVLFIMVDTLRADHLGAYGKTDARTPTIDALAADGLVFERAFSQASWTRSSGASLWTSRLPSSHNADTKAARLSDEVVTWAEALHDGGVSTGALVNNINLTESFGFNQGFDAFVYEAPAYRFGGTESVFALTWYKVVHKVAEKVLAGAPKQVGTYYQPASVVLADARRFIEHHRDGRWGLYVHLMEPHDPYFEHPSVRGDGDADYSGVGVARAEVESPDPARADELHGLYEDEIAFMDGELAPFVTWLRDEGLYDDVAIVFTADHGEEFQEHGGWWHGTTLYDEQLHVPLIMKLPGNAQAGTRVPFQVRSLDVAPTLATLAGVTPDPSWVGADLIAGVAEYEAAGVAYLTQINADAALAREEAAREAQLALGDAPEGGVEAVDVETPVEAAVPPVLVDERAADPCWTSAFDRVAVAEEDFEGNVLHGIRTGGYKFIRANAGNPRGLPEASLFQVAVDPGEQSNLLGGVPGELCGRFSATDWSGSLETTLGEEIAAAVAGAAGGGTATMTAVECERLKALGYLGAGEDCG